MLTLTENARSAVADLTTKAGLPDSGGLRIAESPDQIGSFELSLVTEPAPGDDVILEGPAHVFVSPETSTTLADQELDVEDASGGAGFKLSQQA